MLFFSSFLVPLTILFSCGKENVPVPRDFNAENVIIVIMDGARWSETWGDSSRQYIPNMAQHMAPEGALLTNFYNDGETRTIPGHTAITTAYYQSLSNTGTELPEHPSLFQYTIAQKTPALKAWIITSKDKLQVLANCEDTEYHNKFVPANNCGKDGGGVGSGYREDSLTYAVVVQTLAEMHPKLMLINFKNPDASAHTGDWDKYVNGIKKVDKYIFDLWTFIQQDPVYKDKTTLIITNDHGRHLDGVSSGFKSHGDDCDGCRHIMFLVLGPDIRKGITLTDRAGQVDIPVTVAKMLNVDFPGGEGRFLGEILIPEM